MKRGPKPGAKPSKAAIYKRLQRATALLTRRPELLKEFDEFGQIYHDIVGDWLLLKNPHMYDRTHKLIQEIRSKQSAVLEEAYGRIMEIIHEAKVRITEIDREIEAQVEAHAEEVERRIAAASDDK